MSSISKAVFAVIMAGAFSNSFAQRQEKIYPVHNSSGKYGYADANGKLVVAYNWDYADSFRDGLAVVNKSRQFGYVNEKGKQVIPCRYDRAGRFASGYAIVSHNDLYGIIDTTGRAVVPTTYDYVSNYHDGLAWVKNEKRKYGFADARGKIVVPLKYDWVEDFSEGLAIAGNLTPAHDSLVCGYIDTKGKEVISPGFRFSAEKHYRISLASFHHGLALMYQHGKYGFINKAGDVVVPYQYDDYEPGITPALSLVERDGKRGLADSTGKEIIPCKYGYFYPVSDGLIRFEIPGGKYGLYGYMDETGREVIPPVYDENTDFSDGYAAVWKDGKWKMIDKTGKDVFPDYEESGWRYFPDGLYKVKKNGKWGVTDRQHKEVVACQYDDIQVLAKDIYLVQKNKLWGAIRPDGSEVLPCTFHQFLLHQPLAPGEVVVAIFNRKYCLVDHTGKQLCPLQYDEIKWMSYDGPNGPGGRSMMLAKKDNKWGVLNNTGKEVMPCRFEDIVMFEPGLISVFDNEHFSIYNLFGKEIGKPADRQ